MSKKRYDQEDTAHRIRGLKTRRVRRSLTPGKVTIHNAAQSAFSMWRDLRRQYHPGALIKPEIALALLSHVPVQAVMAGNKWQLFGGFETYTNIQSLAGSRDKIRVEIVHYTNISHGLVECLSLALLVRNFECYSLHDAVAAEQARKRLKTGFSQRAQLSVLACDPTSRERHSASINTSASALKRQAERLRRSCSPDANFIADILEGLQHEETD